MNNNSNPNPNSNPLKVSCFAEFNVHATDYDPNTNVFDLKTDYFKDLQTKPLPTVKYETKPKYNFKECFGCIQKLKNKNVVFDVEKLIRDYLATNQPKTATQKEQPNPKPLGFYRQNTIYPILSLNSDNDPKKGWKFGNQNIVRFNRHHGKFYHPKTLEFIWGCSDSDETDLIKWKVTKCNKPDIVTPTAIYEFTQNEKLNAFIPKQTRNRLLNAKCLTPSIIRHLLDLDGFTDSGFIDIQTPKITIYKATQQQKHVFTMQKGVYASLFAIGGLYDPINNNLVAVSEITTPNGFTSHVWKVQTDNRTKTFIPKPKKIQKIQIPTVKKMVINKYGRTHAKNPKYQTYKKL
jgi:hypothetical protein